MHFNIEVNVLIAGSLFYQNKPLVRNKTIGKMRLYLKQKQKALPVMFEDLHITSVAKLGMMHSLKISLRLGAKNMPERFIRIILVFISSHV